MAKYVDKRRQKTERGARRPGRGVLVVKDDLPEAVPVLNCEVDVIDAFLTRELDPLLREEPPHRSRDEDGKP